MKYLVDMGRFVLQTATVEVEADSKAAAIVAAHAAVSPDWQTNDGCVRDVYAENARSEEEEFEPTAEAMAAYEGFDQVQACREGWAFFEGDSGIRLERIEDDPDGVQLDSDEQAWAIVTVKAAGGSDYHLRALAVLAAVNPFERQRIRDFSGF